MSIQFKTHKECKLFRCLKCWKLILPEEDIGQFQDGYIHAVCQKKKKETRKERLLRIRLERFESRTHMNGRKCSICSSFKTKMIKTKTLGIRPVWRKDWQTHDFVCLKCYHRRRYQKENNLPLT